MSAEAVPAYPATFTFDPPETIARWRVIGNVILAIPHFIIAYVLNIVAEVLAFVAWILGVFTGKVPEGILGVIAMYAPLQHASQRLCLVPQGGVPAVHVRHDASRIRVTIRGSGSTSARDRGSQPADDLLPHHPGHPAHHRDHA